jgi:hypothetical protein
LPNQPEAQVFNISPRFPVVLDSASAFLVWIKGPSKGTTRPGIQAFYPRIKKDLEKKTSNSFSLFFFQTFLSYSIRSFYLQKKAASHVIFCHLDIEYEFAALDPRNHQQKNTGDIPASKKAGFRPPTLSNDKGIKLQVFQEIVQFEFISFQRIICAPTPLQR